MAPRYGSTSAFEIDRTGPPGGRSGWQPSLAGGPRRAPPRPRVESGVLSSAVGPDRDAACPARSDRSIDGGPQTDGQACPRQHLPTRPAPAAPAPPRAATGGQPAPADRTAASPAEPAGADRRRGGPRRRARGRDRRRGERRPRKPRKQAARPASAEPGAAVRAGIDRRPRRPPRSTPTSRATSGASRSSAARSIAPAASLWAVITGHRDPDPLTASASPAPVRGGPPRYHRGPCHPPRRPPAAPDPRRCSSHRPSASRWPPGCARATSTSSSARTHLVGERGPLRREHRPRPPRVAPAVGAARHRQDEPRPPARRARSAPISRRCRRSCRASSRSARTIAEAQERLALHGTRTRPVPRRDPSLQQGPAGRPAAPRRGRHGHAHRRDDREPLLRGQLGAPVADARLAARGPDRRRGRRRSCVARSTDEERGLAGALGPDGGVALTTTPSSTSSRSPAATPARRSTSSKARPPWPKPRTSATPTAGSARDSRTSRPPPSSGSSPTTAPATATTTPCRRSSRACAATTPTPRSTGWRR